MLANSIWTAMAKQLDERVRILSTWPPGAESVQVHICYPLRRTAAPTAQKEKHNGKSFGDKRCRGSRKWTSGELTPWPNMYWLADPETVRQKSCNPNHAAELCSRACSAVRHSLQPCVPTGGPALVCVGEHRGRMVVAFGYGCMHAYSPNVYRCAASAGWSTWGMSRGTRSG